MVVAGQIHLKGELLETEGEIDARYGGGRGDIHPARSEVQDTAHPGGDQRVRDRLGILCGNRDDPQLDVALDQLLLDHCHVVDDPITDRGPDGRGVVVEDMSDVEVLLVETAVGKQSSTDVSRTHQRCIPGLVATEDSTQVVVEHGHGITDPRVSQLSDEGEILPHLSVGETERLAELTRAHIRLFIHRTALAELSEVETEPLGRGIRDLGLAIHASSLPIGAYNALMHFSDVYQKQDTTFSFEFFPPGTEKGWNALGKAISDLEMLSPDFVSVTYGAGGSTRNKTHDLVVKLKTETGLDPIPHLTCVEHDESEIREILTRYARAGVSNILALRGDAPLDSKSRNPFEHFRYAVDLVRSIREFNQSGEHGDPRGFGVAVAGFPEGHPETPNTLTQMDHLKRKVDEGADVVVTQMFFDNNSFFDWKERCEIAGIDVPIVAGIMPINSLAGLRRMADLAAGTRFPAKLLRTLQRAGEDPESVTRIGTHWATEQCLELRDQGVSGIHFYTLNKSIATVDIFKTLGMANA